MQRRVLQRQTLHLLMCTLRIYTHTYIYIYVCVCMYIYAGTYTHQIEFCCHELHFDLYLNLFKSFDRLK